MVAVKTVKTRVTYCQRWDEESQELHSMTALRSESQAKSEPIKGAQCTPILVIKGCVFVCVFAYRSIREELLVSEIAGSHEVVREWLEVGRSAPRQTQRCGRDGPTG